MIPNTHVRGCLQEHGERRVWREGGGLGVYYINSLVCNLSEDIVKKYIFAGNIYIKYVNKNTLAGFLFFIYQMYLQKGNNYIKCVCRIFGFSYVKYICRMFFSQTYVHRQRRASFCVHICRNVCIYVHALVCIFLCVPVFALIRVCVCVCVLVCEYVCV